MSREIRDFETMYSALVRDLEMAKLEKECWEKVKVVKKKDGSDFANRNKSFENATFGPTSYMDEFHPVVSVSGRGNKVGYQNFQLYCYLYIDEMSKDDPRVNQASPKVSCLRQTYILTADETFELIKKRIATLETRIKSIEKQIKDSKKVYEACIKELNTVAEKIRKSCDAYRNTGDDVSGSTLEYYIASICENRIYSAIRR